MMGINKKIENEKECLRTKKSEHSNVMNDIKTMKKWENDQEESS